MSDHEPGHEVVHTQGASPDGDVHGAIVRRDDELPVHEPRRSDVDPRAARRVERQVSLLFLVGLLSPFVFWVLYVYIPKDKVVTIPFIGATSASNFWLGIVMGVGLLCVGVGAIHWAKKLMPAVEEAQERHPLGGDAEDRSIATDDFVAGTEGSGFLKYKMIRRTLIGALATTPLFALPLLKDLGPMPGDKLRHTIWAKGIRIVTDPTLNPLRPEDIPFGGLVNCIPANLPEVEEATGTQDARAKAPVILIRMRPEEIKAQQGPNWDYEGILCFSKICTHVGCPTSLYEQKTHNLLCPCHQSTFDLSDAGHVVFGPAVRALPQLAINVDSDGYLVARGDFTQPVGPSFWERG